MTDERKVIHLPRHRASRNQQDDLLWAIESIMTGHFREQNDVLRATNDGLAQQVQRLAASVERLLGEVNGVRTGRADEAFARFATEGADANLAMVKADVANLYPFTSKKIGDLLGFGATQIGQLLGPGGLRWAGNSDYQEMTRWEKGHMRHWHTEVPDRLRAILTDDAPEKHDIQNATVIQMFKRWKMELSSGSASPKTQ